MTRSSERLAGPTIKESANRTTSSAVKAAFSGRSWRFNQFIGLSARRLVLAYDPGHLLARLGPGSKGFTAVLRRIGNPMRRIAATCLMLLAATPALADPPRRIASFNLCADQLVVALADSNQIAALSPYARDDHLSVVAERARHFPALSWSAEGTVALSPDLVLVG